MKGIDKLLQLDPSEIAQKTFISNDELKAIIEKDFNYFGKSKAIGFIKILEREYNLDLSDWMEEFNASKEEGTDDIFVIAPNENNTVFKNKLYLISLAVAVLLFMLLFIFYPSNNRYADNIHNSNNYIVEEAKQKIEEKTNTQEVTEIPKKETVVEVPVKKDEFYLFTQSDLWIGITYLDNDKKDEKIIKNGLELDPTRDQVIILGHGYFKLTLNDQVIEPKSSNVHRITYKEGRLNVYKIPNKKIIEDKKNKLDSTTIEPEQNEQTKPPEDIEQTEPETENDEILLKNENFEPIDDLESIE